MMTIMHIFRMAHLTKLTLMNSLCLITCVMFNGWTYIYQNFHPDSAVHLQTGFTSFLY